ncbi:uncharacterized protein K460DRAFT_369801 [Cucurbitaria berberidis CBS 394.84]|uniref:Autophagy-related protein 6 n=1 Tax=Cucurbitaria berberidis CBS 394.84 TaxID=1168544 RepID=A0A9P4L4Y5_9PLEO|nr:uncharacterized protein K460DRAFT_369801 [Cucurbitaria berberidis CBS 394.84]KAF1841789.1 hypothetical protein K460DRAFT_369801 [Cucurbitaria berberidis CBS 394.84]
MGWLWGSGNSASAQDQLDPSLRDFLQKQAPTGPKPTLPSPPKEKPSEPPAPTQAQSQSHPAIPEKPAVPPQSQFQDGRYAHLWKNYTPQNVLDDRGKSEQDRLRDLVDAYNDRRASVGRVAMENCALEYLEQFECFRHPATWWSAGTMCNAESRKFNRCYDIQSKFLKALGYMTMDARTPDEDERIQMHADKLYQQMLQQEAEIEKAKEEGKPLPKFESVMSKQNMARSMAGASSTAAPVSGARNPYTEDETENDIWSHIKPESRREYEKKLAALPPEQQEIERMAVLGELKASTGMAKQVEETFIEERIQRMKRREAGQATFGDTIKHWWGWG